ncbi:MAG: histidine phosphatase family protein [Clostridia bacterium]|nr:histidine phosphatase family protein [Clostridia bacterium]
MVTTIYLVRHCEARGNVDREFHGSFDSDITEGGKVQLCRLSERFRDIPIDALYSSPLKRAHLTAQAVNKYHGLPIAFDARLEELHGGKWERNLWAELPKLFPESSEAWGDRPHEFEAPDGETMRQLYDRMKEALLDIAAQNEGKTIAVASHGCAIRNALCWGLTGDIARLGDIPWCDNTAVSVFEIDGDNVTVTNYNDSSHLDAETSTLEKQNWWRKDAPNVFE